jgi:hypothetical protein
MYFFLGLCYVGRYFGTFINLEEYCPERWKNLLCSFLLALDVLHYMAIIAYFKYVKNSLYLEIYGLILNFIAIACVLWLPESPVYLQNMFHFKESKESLYYIAKINRAPAAAEGLESFADFKFDVEQDYGKCLLSDITPMG